MSDFYPNNNDFNQNGYYDGQYNSGYDNSQAVYNPGYDSSLKAILAQEVVAKSFLFMFGALLITAFASLTTSFETAFVLLSGNNFVFFVLTQRIELWYNIR